MISKRGIIIAAPSSGSGKTTVTLGLLRALHDRNVSVVPFKTGPDYIDPGFHTLAAEAPCANLDPWAMRPGLIGDLIFAAPANAMMVCEGVMGLFDGATAEAGSTADLAAMTGWPVVLVVDAARQASSAAAVVKGFATMREDVHVAGVIFNRVASQRHRRHIAEAMTKLPDIHVLGYLPPNDALRVPSRHLGLVQALEIGSVEAMIDAAAGHVADHLDLDAFQALTTAGSTKVVDSADSPPVPPLGQRIAVADDEAFGFCYPHVLESWRRAGASVALFSPLAGDGLPDDVDAVYLPGGYPELHAPSISANVRFLDGLRAAADQGRPIFGECGGYMVLGHGIVDADGDRFAMAGLLPVETSFAERKLHLGYRRATLTTDCVLGASGDVFRAHEFHYATVASDDDDGRLFDLEDAFGDPHPAAGHTRGSVVGSFIHLIDRERG